MFKWVLIIGNDIILSACKKSSSWSSEVTFHHHTGLEHFENSLSTLSNVSQLKYISDLGLISLSCACFAMINLTPNCGSHQLRDHKSRVLSWVKMVRCNTPECRSASCRDHTSPSGLTSLPMCETQNQIQGWIYHLLCKTLHNQAPAYIQEVLIARCTGTTVRSPDHCLVAVHPSELKTKG